MYARKLQRILEKFSCNSQTCWCLGDFGGIFVLAKLNQLGVDQPAVWSPDIYPLQLQGGLGGPVITGVISLRL